MRDFCVPHNIQISAWVQVGYDGADKSYSRYLDAKSISAGSLVACPKILEKPPNWNLLVQEELFSHLLL